jgi:hypothetical protein
MSSINQTNPDLRKKTRKSTKGIVNLRIAAVYQMVLQGESRAHIKQYTQENWGMSEGQTDEYLRRANIIIETETETEGNKHLKKQIAGLKVLMSKTYRKGEHHLVLEAMKELNKLLGLYPAEQHKHILDGKVHVEEEKKIDFSKVTNETLLKIIEAADGHKPDNRRNP